VAEPLRILVVEDEPDMCWALDRILRGAGYEVTIAGNGAQALRLVGKESYAAAFVDAKLPDVDGLEVAAQIKQDSPRTGVVIVSGYFYADDQAIIDSLENGLLVGFVGKPFDTEQLLRMAQQATGHANG